MSDKLSLTLIPRLALTSGILFVLGFAFLIGGILDHDNFKIIALGMGLMGAGAGMGAGALGQLEHNKNQVANHEQASSNN